MTPGQTHPRRRGLNELMESVAAKLAERPDHIAAARVLEEMQADAAQKSRIRRMMWTCRMDSLKCPPPPPPPPLWTHKLA